MSNVKKGPIKGKKILAKEISKTDRLALDNINPYLSNDEVQERQNAKGSTRKTDSPIPKLENGKIIVVSKRKVVKKTTPNSNN